MVKAVRLPRKSRKGRDDTVSQAEAQRMFFKWFGEEKLVDVKDEGSTTIESLEYPEFVNILPAVSTPLHCQIVYWSGSSGNTSHLKV